MSKFIGVTKESPGARHLGSVGSYHGPNWWNAAIGEAPSPVSAKIIAITS
ncbi:MAG: hypothetical protein WBW85_10530 [Terriglobales bacterium]